MSHCIVWYWISWLLDFYFPFSQEHYINRSSTRKAGHFVLFFCCLNFVAQIKSMFLLIYCISHISGYTCKQWIWMDKHILWKIKPWFSIAFVKLTILEIWIKYWFLSKYEQLKHWVSEALLFSNNFWFFWLNHQNTFPKDIDLS